MYIQKKKTVLIFILSIPLLVLLISLKNGNMHLQFNELFSKQLDSLKMGLIELKSETIAKNYRNSKRKYLQFRDYYKQIEFLLEFKFPTLCKEKINANPLPRLERNSFNSNVLEPHGLQVLDELIFEKNINFTEVNNEIILLEKIFSELPEFEILISEFWIAARIQIVRLAHLTLASFDAPGSRNGLQDVKSSLMGIRKFSHFLFPEKKSEIEKMEQRYLRILNNSIEKLKGEANGFNYFQYIKYSLNPLFSIMLQIHLQQGWDMPQEINSMPQAINYLSENLFSESILNKNYFYTYPAQIQKDSIILLGQYLFFDPVLSASNKMACATCHSPEKAFTDGKKTSVQAYDKAAPARNAMSLENCVYTEKFFWDLRSEHLIFQMDHVVSNAQEFNSNWFEIAEKLQKSKEYKNLFVQIFKQSQIQPQQIKLALSAYVAHLTGFNSFFDSLLNKEFEKTKYNLSIVNGFNLFIGKGNCATCHFTPTFAGLVPPYFQETESEVLAVPSVFPSKKATLDLDLGRYSNILKEKHEIYKFSFKTPTLRGVEKTAPYMHNGAFKTLEDVMDFYNKGGGAGFNIYLENQTLGTDKLNLSKQEIKDIILFLKSLSNTKIFSTPTKLPLFTNDSLLNKRSIGGE